ncbi:ABC transporter substrate-binding protein [Paenibacillus glycinis]|uniref:Extracellular solute-binding protein n=1 Tax=Paenibacillus glycinis TaxID=2697035 RepID=A0ABW9XVE2_9BACL|nr:extracellular solute-binding protein [Paenibacillus glycinis]NBD26277.1 extracellular solute-binding protein [Paenibacillus glycinis]
MMKSAHFGKARLLIAGLVLVAAAGCGRDGHPQPAASEAAAGAEERETLTFALQDTAETQDIERLIAAFNTDHPDAPAKLLLLPRDTYDESLNMLMTSGEGPDVFQIGTGWLTSYIYKNWLLDLSEAAPDDVRRAFPGWAADYTKLNDHYYAIPSGMLTVRLIYNKNLLAGAGCDPDKPPAALAELKRCAVGISKAGTGYRKYGFALPASEDEAGFQQPLEMAGTYSGAYYYDYAKGKYDFSVYLPWFRTVLDMKREGGLFPGEMSLKTDTALTQFAEGNIGMMIVSSRDIAALERMRPGSFEWGIAMPPLFDEADKGKGALMIEPEPPYAVNAYTTHKEAAVELWQYLLSSGYLGELYKQSDLIPARSDVANDERYRPELPSMRQFLPTNEESIYPQEPEFILKNEQAQFTPSNLGDAARMKAYRDILQGLRDPKDALAELSAQYNRSLHDAVYLNPVVNLNDYVYPAFDPRHPLRSVKQDADEG